MDTRVSDWKNILLQESDTVSKALNILGDGGYQLGLVIDPTQRFLGIVTDSDVRKALLRGVELDDRVDLVMNKYPLVVSPCLGDIDALEIMICNHYFHLPVVDSTGRLVGLHVAAQYQHMGKRSETLIIMAGGRGKRLMPLTTNVPKPMLPLNGKPILQHIIERAIRHGFEHVVITVNYLANVITDYFGDGSKFNINIEYIHEQYPLGTAGSLCDAIRLCRSDYVLVTNGDIITDIPYAQFMRQAVHDTVDGLMAVRLQEWQSPYGVVRSKDLQFLSIDEKPVMRYQVNAGLYVVKRSLMHLLERNTYCDMTDLFSKGARSGLNVRIFPLYEPWIDIGQHEDYSAAIQMYP